MTEQTSRTDRGRIAWSFPGEPSGKLTTPSHERQTTVEELVALVNQAPRVASRLLAYANSPFDGTFRRLVSSTTQAAALLGRETVRTIALGFAFMEQSDPVVV